MKRKKWTDGKRMTVRRKGDKRFLRFLAAKGIGVPFSLKVFAACQCVFLLLLLASSIGLSRVVRTFKPEEFNYQDKENIKIKEDGLMFDPMEGITDDDKQVISSEPFSLPSGGYQLTVSYISDTDGSGNVANITGEVSLISEHHEVETTSAVLSDGRSSVTARQWIPTFSGCDDLRLEIRYNGRGFNSMKTE